jgi:transcriptional regulator with XRE-family HTH domain
VETLADRLAYARSLSKYGGRGGITALAEAAGTTKGTISRYESGERETRVEYAIVRRIADALSVRADWLLSGEAPMRPDGTLAPKLGKTQSLEEVLRIYPGRWSKNTVEAAKAAYLHGGRPEQGWVKLLDQLEKTFAPAPKAKSKGTRRPRP